MKMWVKALATSLVVASLVSSPVQAAATKVTPSMAAVAAACNDLSGNAGGRHGCVEELRKSIAADPANLKALQEAAGKGTEGKALLQKLGVSEAELAEAKVVINDQSHGAARAKVTIEVTCCPLTITITIRL